MINELYAEAIKDLTTNEAWSFETRFAELVIEECARTLFKDGALQYQAMIKLKEHFEL
jgi:hypothetical protein